MVVKRLHQCADKVWRHAPNVVQAVSVRLIKLDVEGKPTGETAAVGTASCVHFGYADDELLL